MLGWQDNAFCPSKLYPCLLQRLRVWIGGLRHNATCLFRTKSSHNCWRFPLKSWAHTGQKSWRNYRLIRQEKQNEFGWKRLRPNFHLLNVILSSFAWGSVKTMVPAAASWNGVVTILGIGLEVRHLNTYLPTDVSISSLTKTMERWPRNHLFNTEISAKRHNGSQIGSFSVWNKLTQSEG